MPFPYADRDWVNVPEGTAAPPGAPVADEAWFEAVEDALREHDGHQAAVYAVHGGLVWYVAASSVPPLAPPTGLPWRRTDTKEAVWNSGTSGAPVWEPLADDLYKLTAADLVTDYVISGLLPPVPINSMTVQIPLGAAYIIGKRVAKAAEPRTVLSGKSTLVDLSSSGVYTNVDNGILLDDCEDTWNEKTDADFVQSIVAGPSGGGNAVRFAIAAGASAGDSVSEAIPSTDLTPYGKLRVRIRSSITVAPGDLQVLLDNTASVVSPVHTLNVPALVANTWTTVDIAYNNATAGTNAIISVGLKLAVDVGAVNVDIADVWALKDPEPAVTASSIRLFEARADRDIVQKELVDIVAANSTLYTIRINGVDITYTSDASATEGEIALGLVAAINASVDPSVTPVTAATTALATDAAATFTITADVAGVPFTILGDTRLTVTEVAPNSIASVTEIVDRRALIPTVRGTIGHILRYAGADLPQRTRLEVVGGGASFADDEPNDKTVLTISTGARTLVVLGADVANSTTSLADVVGLSFVVSAGQVYRVYAIIEFDAALATTGSRWTLNGPAGTAAITSRWTSAATTNQLQNLTAYETATVSTASLATARNLAIIEGILRPSASGTVIVRFASEVAASAITAKAGSTLEYW